MNEKVLLGTTPTIKYHINSDVNLAGVKEAEIAIRQTLKHNVKSASFTYTSGRVEIVKKEKLVYVTLTQEETLQFSSGLIDIQLRMLFDDGLAVATRISTVRTGDLLKGGVIS